MNFRVDLILQTERRSASVLTLKALARISGIAGPLVVALCIALMALKAHALQQELRWAEEQWAEMDPMYQEAQKLRTRLACNRAIRHELRMWRESRIPWHQHLQSLALLVPTNVALTEIKVGALLQMVNEAPARVYTMDLVGKAVGSQPEVVVASLQEDVRHRLAFGPVMDSVEVVKFMADPSRDAAKTDRLFQLHCRYVPGSLE